MSRKNHYSSRNRDRYDGYGSYDGYGDSRTISLYNELPTKLYNLIIGGILFYGFIVNAIIVKLFASSLAELPFLPVVIGYFICCIAGIFMSKLSDNPIISFIGYNLVVVPVGVILAIAIHVDGFEPAQIIHAAALTAFFTGIMIIASMIWEDFFLSLGKILFIGLTAIVIFEVICLIFGIYLPTIWDILVAVLFCFYIGYDWAKAQEEDHTTDNAVDACVGLYLDIINLFIRILSASSNSRSKSRK